MEESSGLGKKTNTKTWFWLPMQKPGLGHTLATAVICTSQYCGHNMLPPPCRALLSHLNSKHLGRQIWANNFLVL